jgi:hypothetical protein
MSRTQSGLSPNANASINAIVSARKDLFELYYETTGQDSNACFYYPVFDGTPNVIRLPGSCDPSIKGIPNFNADAVSNSRVPNLRRLTKSYFRGLASQFVLNARHFKSYFLIQIKLNRFIVNVPTYGAHTLFMYNNTYKENGP